jgi:hypothetical protein
MKARESSWKTPKIGFRQSLLILAPYVKKKVLEQVRSVAVIVLYLLFFQTVVLRIQINEALTIAIGLAIVIVGLTLFMEGLFLGLMRLGEVIGVKLPEKTNVGLILSFSFVLGLGATFAEPAIGILKSAGAGVRPWEAPLLFHMLNVYPEYVVYAVGIGVGVAVVFGMLRYLYGWSLKPFIYALVVVLLALTGWAYMDPKLSAICGLSWDCGAVTTGPVTVPLVLALGIGVCRVVSRDGTESTGFGVVTLASLFPILSVLVLGIFLSSGLPDPMSEAEFYSAKDREVKSRLFRSENGLKGYVLQNGNEGQQRAFFDGSEEGMLSFLGSLAEDEARRKEVFGADAGRFQQWVHAKATADQRRAVLGNQKAEGLSPDPSLSPKDGLSRLIGRNTFLAFQAVIPLTLFLVFVLVVFLREKLPQADEVILGIALALVGMAFFNIGIEVGLAKLGNQVGQKLPSSFKTVALTEQEKRIVDFETRWVQTATDAEGNEHPFFFMKQGNRIESVPFNREMLDPETDSYRYVPQKGPLFGKENGVKGILVVVLFALIMGYGATLAEPALNALGLTVEEITVGVFKKNTLMQSVAFGVGAGIALGVLKIILNIPLFWLLAPLYVFLLFLTRLSTEEFVNIGWDSAGVTTGPITVPLVLAMGLGIGNEIGVIEGFGILAMASVCPIMTVLFVGLRVTRAQKAVLKESARNAENRESAAP